LNVKDSPNVNRAILLICSNAELECRRWPRVRISDASCDDVNPDVSRLGMHLHLIGRSGEGCVCRLIWGMNAIIPVHQENYIGGGAQGLPSTVQFQETWQSHAASTLDQGDSHKSVIIER
jgi:hypothetical protein